MKISNVSQNAAVMATIFCLSACSSNGSQLGGNAPNDKTVVADQAEWQKLTTAADAALKQGDKATAEKDYKAAVDEAEKLGAETVPQADALANLANFYYVQGDGAQADGVYKKALAIHEKALGLEHVDLVKDLVGLGRVSHAQNNDTEAASYYARAIAISDKAKQPVAADVTAEYNKLKDTQKTK